MKRVVLSSLALLFACESDEFPVPATTTEDSAGVAIIRSSGAAWKKGTGWRLPEAPRISIGADLDDEKSSFSAIRGAIRLSDSRIVVADRGNDELRVFGPDGVLLKTVGRSGEGPGEYRSLWSIGPLPGDSFFAYDSELVRVSIYDDTAGFVQVVRLPVFFAAVDRLPDGRWVGATSEGGLGSAPTPSTPRGIMRPEAAVIVLDGNGSEPDTIATVLGHESYVGQVWGRVGVMPAPFGRTFSLVVRGQELLFALGESLGFDVRSPAGELVTRVQGPALTREIGPEEATAYRTAMMAGFSAVVGESMETLLDQAGLPAEKALVSDMLTTPGGMVWLSAYQNYRYYTGLWHVIDPKGAYLGEVQLPHRFELLEAGDDYLLGKWRDDLGVNSIRMYEIDKR